jgi:hypothetical protein
MPVEDLIALRGLPGVSIPDDDVLHTMAQMRFSSTADMSIDSTSQARGEQTGISTYRIDPKHRLVEVLIYWSRDRLIWCLARCYAAINQRNPFGFFPFCKAPFILVEGKAYSMSMPDALENDQKYAQGIRNSRLDNLALMLHPPRTQPRGTADTPGSRSWAPGQLNELAKPDEHIVHTVDNVTADAFREEQMIHAGAAKRFGINDFVQSGVPTPSNANRTAGGVMQQSKNVSQRLWTAVTNFEDYLIVPMLYKMQKMIEKYAPEQLEFMQGDETATITKEEIGRPVKFKMDAASRMLAKDRLAMFLQPISMLLFNEQVMKQANMQGKTINFAEWTRFFQDATSTSKAYDFFRPMSAQEQQALNQPPPEVMMRMQEKQIDAQVRMQAMQTKAKTETEIARMEAEAQANSTAENSALSIIETMRKERESKDKQKADLRKAVMGVIQSREKARTSKPSKP